MAIVEVEELRKEYGTFTAVEGSTFSIGQGEVFGVVGPNGAGKTTTLKMLAGLIEPTAGTATVAGHEPGEPAMQRRLGFLPEESPLYEDMTAREYLSFFADLYGVPRDIADDRIERTLDRLELAHRDRPLGNVSKGMKRKVAITRALVNDPDVLIFDEPASGLDPLTTNYIIEFVQELRETGKTIVFSAHNLYHVERICDRIAVMNDGRIVARGTVEAIRETHGGTEYHVFATVDGSAGLERLEPDAALETTRSDGTVEHVVGEMAHVEAIREAVEDRGGQVTDIQTETPSLEEIFLEIAGRGAVVPGTDVDAGGETGRDAARSRDVEVQSDRREYPEGET